jgi:ADP-ribose pyrophosphatase YjhB (NUDIX family)
MSAVNDFRHGDRVRYTAPPGNNPNITTGTVGRVVQVLEQGKLLGVRFTGHAWAWAIPAGHLEHAHIIDPEIHFAMVEELRTTKQELSELKRALRTLSE